MICFVACVCNTIDRYISFRYSSATQSHTDSNRLLENSANEQNKTKKSTKTTTKTICKFIAGSLGNYIFIYTSCKWDKCVRERKQKEAHKKKKKVFVHASQSSSTCRIERFNRNSCEVNIYCAMESTQISPHEKCMTNYKRINTLTQHTSHTNTKDQRN